MAGKLHHRRIRMGLFNPLGVLVHVGSETACLRAWANLRGEGAVRDGLDLAHLRVKVRVARWSIREVLVAVLSPDADLTPFESDPPLRRASPDR